MPTKTNLLNGPLVSFVPSCANVVTACLLAITGTLGLGGAVVHAQKFFPDDPLTTEPPPLAVVNPQPRALSEILELFNNTVNRPGERHPRAGVIAAGGVNTLGEVMDSDWFVNRHATRRLTPEELVRGPGTSHAPDPGGPWRVLTVRPRGIRPGILVADARDRIYLLMFDPPDHPELATGSQMVSSRIAHAIGYFVPECYLVRFDQNRLAITERSEIVSSAGNRRALTPTDLDIFFRGVAPSGQGSHRAVAIYISQDEWRAYLGPFQLFTRRSDDPNDVVVHEHRRDLRGLFVISAWLDHAWMRAVATVDMLAEVDGIPRIRHFLVDFFGTLGSGRNEVKQAWEGNGPLLDGGSIFRNALGLGIWSPAWMREQFPGIPAVGRFAYSTFDPERWSPVERLAAFENRLPDDEYLGGQAGRGVHRPGHRRHRLDGGLHGSGRGGVDHQHAHCPTRPDRADLLPEGAAARRLPRRRRRAQVRRSGGPPRRGRKLAHLRRALVPIRQRQRRADPARGRGVLCRPARSDGGRVTGGVRGERGGGSRGSCQCADRRSVAAP